MSLRVNIENKISIIRRRGLARVWNNKNKHWEYSKLEDEKVLEGNLCSTFGPNVLWYWDTERESFTIKTPSGIYIYGADNLGINITKYWISYLMATDIYSFLRKSGQPENIKLLVMLRCIDEFRYENELFLLFYNHTQPIQL